MKPFLTIIALVGWVPVAVGLFATLPARRATLVTLIAGWMLLPTASFDLPGLPAFDKDASICVGVLAGSLLFDPRPFLALRLRWFDLPIVLYCLAAFATSISNGLGPYDGVSAAFGQLCRWALPYLVGRACFTKAEDLRGLEIAIVASVLCAVPFCLVEMRIGGELQRMIYGVGQWEVPKDGFYRPKLFFQSGLTLGMWMYLGCLSAWWLWRARLFSTLRGLPVGRVVLPVIVTISVLCRATGATILAMLGAGLLRFCPRARNSLAVWALIVLAPIYCAARVEGLWTGNFFVDLTSIFFSKERAESMGARIFEEDHLIARASLRPKLGWGGYNRMRIIEEGAFGRETKMLSLVDSLWSITFGTQGLVGLSLLGTAMLLPSALFLVRVPAARWGDPEHAPTALLAVFLVLYVLDCLANAMINPIYIVALGGVSNVAMARPRAVGATAKANASESRRSRPAAETGPRKAAARRRPGTAGARHELAARYQELGRGAKDRGRLAEARDAWSYALELWRDPGTERAGGPEAPARRRECANDLAWLLAEAADPALRAPARAVALALETTAAAPDQAAYWNTLGAAHYRAGDFRAAIAALERATALADGGGPFDHLFLAMANARIGHEELARLWAEQAADAMAAGQPVHPELRRLREEAEAVLASCPAGPARQLEAP